MSIVRTIMKIVLIIIGLIAVVAADDNLGGVKYYITDYVPYTGRGEYKEDLGESYRLPSYRHQERGVPRSYDAYSNVPYPDQRIGLHGFGFENRVAAFGDGLRNPITPKALEHVGYRSMHKDLQFVPY